MLHAQLRARRDLQTAEFARRDLCAPEMSHSLRDGRGSDIGRAKERGRVRATQSGRCAEWGCSLTADSNAQIAKTKPTRRSLAQVLDPYLCHARPESAARVTAGIL